MRLTGYLVLPLQMFPTPDASRINLRKGAVDKKGSGLNYALGKHGINSPIKVNKSKFTISDDEVKNILSSKTVINSPITKSPTTDYFVREVDLGQGNVVGTVPTKYGGQSTTIITVITDVKGNLVNTFPGKLNTSSQ